MNIYSRLSKKYDDLYIENILQFQKNMLGLKSQEYVDFYPVFGINQKERVEFIIYGQAVNGWRSQFKHLADVNIEKSVAASNEYIPGKINPLDWVNIQWSNSSLIEAIKDEEINCFIRKCNGNSDATYRTSKSFFWNVTYKLICDFYGLGRNSKEWSKKMVWSNLYKIAPDGSNPNSREIEAQKEISIELVKKEIEELKPKYCIFLTNQSWWHPFQEKLSSENLNFDKSLLEIECYQEYLGVKIIVTKRPWRGNSDKFAAQIIELIKMSEK